MSARTIVDYGFDGIVAEIECHTTQGLPSVVIVGFASRAVDEARERIRSAFTSLPIRWPRKRIIINLAPADVPKDTTSFDLAIAVAVLEANSTIPPVSDKHAFFGELGLDGSLRPVRGLIGKLLSAKKHGLDSVFVPRANVGQARLVNGLCVFSLDSLHEAYLHLTGQKAQHPISQKQARYTTPLTSPVYFSDIVGQEQAKRALTIAAAGRHNILLNGPPGTGKSMLAKAMITILPPMDHQEVLETTHLHSLSGKNYHRLITTRPFRAPHHSASDMAVIGGGQKPKPGEISLAHNGILFFDELPEFKRSTIEALRQPLEDRKINIVRAKGSAVFPAHFILVATANPCPCGFYGTTKSCTCLPGALRHYRRKLSGPIMDRIDLYVDVNHVAHKMLLTNRDDHLQNWRRAYVQRAIGRQQKRFHGPAYNAFMTNREVKELARLSSEAETILNRSAGTLALSPRAYMRTIKVARTIADLEDADSIAAHHVAEALQYRPAPNLLP